MKPRRGDTETRRRGERRRGERRRGDTETRRRGDLLKPIPRVPACLHVYLPRVRVSPCLRVYLLRVRVSPCLRVFLILSAFCFPVFAQPGQPGPSSPLYGARPEVGATSSGLPKALQGVSIDQNLDAQLPMDLVFRNENGEAVKLGDYFGKKPVLLSLVYYECPMLCTQVLNGMVSAFRVLSFKPGQEFDVVTVSFDPRETSALAAAKKRTYVGYLPEGKRGPAENGWHFLTGDPESIKRLTETVGFRYHFDEKTNQFAHASAIMVVTPEGKLARYLYGVEYSPKDLRFSLIEASENKIGSPVDQLLLFCYHYDPTTGKYAVVMNMVRGGGIATLIVMMTGFFVLRRRASRTRLRAGGTA